MDIHQQGRETQHISTFSLVKTARRQLAFVVKGVVTTFGGLTGRNLTASTDR
jgi:hypothetical protein